LYVLKHIGLLTLNRSEVLEKQFSIVPFILQFRYLDKQIRDPLVERLGHDNAVKIGRVLNVLVSLMSLRVTVGDTTNGV
jgi:hypothetical protein